MLECYIHKYILSIFDVLKIKFKYGNFNFYISEMINNPNTQRSFNLDNFAAKIKETAVGSIKKFTKDFIITPEQ